MSHLNIETRLQIEKALKKGLNVTQIAKLIVKHHTTFSHEIFKHRSIPRCNIGNHAGHRPAELHRRGEMGKRYMIV